MNKSVIGANVWAMRPLFRDMEKYGSHAPIFFRIQIFIC